MRSLTRKVNLYIALLLAVGLAVFLIKCVIIYPIKYVGHADAAAYAEMADSLIHGRWFEVDYISWYFIKYPKIVRPEDHWPPLYSMTIAPFFLIFGKTAFAAKLPSLIISCFFLPLTAYSLTRELSRSKFAGLAAGFCALFYPVFFSSSLYCLSDIIFTFVICAGVLYAVKAFDDDKYFYPMGIFMGIAYYAKGTGILAIPAYILFHVIARRSIRKVFTNKKFLLSLLIAFLILLPWFIRNYVHFGDPLFSTQRFSAGYIGYTTWEDGTYELYWGDKPPPSVFDKFQGGIGRVSEMTKTFLKRYFWWVIMDIQGKWGKFSKNAFLTYFVNIPAVLGIFLLWGNKKRHAVWITAALLFLFLSSSWEPIDRMAFPMIAIMMALGWATYFSVVKMLLKLLKKIPIARLRLPEISFGGGNLERKRQQAVSSARQYFSFLKSKFSLEIAAGLMVCCIAAPVVIMSAESVQTSIKKSGYPYREGSQEWMDMGKWLSENTPPDTITMTRNPWELHFYSEQLAVQIPRASLEKTIEVMRFYKPDYIIPQLDIRPALKPLVTGEVPGLELAYSNKKLELYRINYDLLPNPEN